MTFASGKFHICAHPKCDSTNLTTVRESWDAQDRIFVGEQHCDDCGCAMLYSRRPSSPMEIQMAKKKDRSRKPRGKKKSTPKTRVTLTDQKGHVMFEGTDKELASAARRVSHRVNTVKSNGALSESVEIAPEAMTVGEAMRLAVEALGDVQVDDDLAPAQMRQLADAFEQVTREQAAFHQKSEAAKIAKKSLESATNLLLEKVRAFTHPAPLPLFDQQQAEDDLDDMQDGGAVDGAEAHA